MAKITGPTPRIPASKSEGTRAPARKESKPVAAPLLTPKLPGTGWSGTARSTPSTERAAVVTAHPRLVHGQPVNDPIFGGSARPAISPRKSLPQPHPRQGHETEARVGVPTQPRPGISFK